MCLALEERALALAAQRNLVVFPEYQDVPWEAVAKDFIWSVELGRQPALAKPCRELQGLTLAELHTHLLSELQLILEAFKVVAAEAVEDYRRHESG